MNADWYFAHCRQPSVQYAARARARQAVLTKPAGSLGRLESLAIELAALQQTDQPSAQRVPILIFAGDHGVTARGVSAYPSAVTVEMLRNFASGGAAIAVLAREIGSSLTVIDAGTLAEEPVAGVETDKSCRGTRDFTTEEAMTPAELAGALACGRRAAARAAGEGADLIILGEMGIGNTTSATAISCALLGRTPEEIVGDGTGVDTSGRTRKAAVISTALALHQLKGRLITPAAALRTMASVGGFEIAALTGAMIASAQAGLPVLVDGFIVSVAALVAARINPGVVPWMIYSHRSAERGHAAVLDELEASPLLDLSLRLGEGSGAAVTLPIVRLACALHNGMATFAEAAVSGPREK